MAGSDRCIRLRGVRQNNLRGIDLDIPLGQITVITGVSGSGKSSLAFDTLYSEGQRRYASMAGLDRVEVEPVRLMEPLR